MAPIIGAAFKICIPFIVILPGLLGLAVLPEHLVAASQATGNLHTYNEVLPLMLARYCGPGLLGLGITALIAGFMSGMAGNVSAFTTVWTYDIYRALINKNATRPALREYGPVGYGDRRAGEHRDRIHGDAIREHHGLCAGAVQHIHRSAVWDGDSGNALEASDRTGGLLGFAVWHGVVVRHVAVGENRSIRASISLRCRPTRK